MEAPQKIQSKVNCPEKWAAAIPATNPDKSQQIIIALALQDEDFVAAVDFGESDADLLAQGGGDVLAHIIGSDGEFPVTAIHQYGQLNCTGTAQVDYRVHGRPHRPAGKEDIVDQDDLLSPDREGELSGPDNRLILFGAEVISVQCDVQLPHRHSAAFELLDPLGNPAGQGHTPGANTQQSQIGTTPVFLNNLVGNPADNPGNIPFVKDLTFDFYGRFLPSWPGLPSGQNNEPGGHSLNITHHCMALIGLYNRFNPLWLLT
jgi:hypothetical protein